MDLTGAGSDPQRVNRLRDMGARVNGALTNMNETSKRLEETASVIAITLVCVTVVSVIALGLAVIALMGTRRSTGRQTDG